MLLAADQHVVGIHAGLLGLAHDRAPKIILADHAQQRGGRAQARQILGHVARTAADADLNHARVGCAGDNIASGRPFTSKHAAPTTTTSAVLLLFVIWSESMATSSRPACRRRGCRWRQRWLLCKQAEIALHLPIRRGSDRFHNQIRRDLNAQNPCSAAMIALTRSASSSTSAPRTYRIRVASRSASVFLVRVSSSRDPRPC